MKEPNFIISKVIADLFMLGSILLLISVILPIYAISGEITYGINIIPGLIFLIGSIIFGFITANKLYKSEFKEEIIRTRQYGLISTILGTISMIIYLSAYLDEINTFSSPSTHFSTGISIYFNFLGLMIITISLIVINRSKNLFPLSFLSSGARSNSNRPKSHKTPLINTSLLDSKFSNKLNSSVSNSNATSQKIKMINCSNCGTNLLENQIFCSNCGIRIT